MKKQFKLSLAAWVMALNITTVSSVTAFAKCDGYRPEHDLDKVKEFWDSPMIVENVKYCIKLRGFNFRNNGYTPLHRAARYSKEPKVITALLKAGADFNAINTNNETPLHVAARYSKEPKVITALCKAGADINAINKSGNTPIHRAANNKNRKAVTALRKACADINAINKSVNTPIHRAANNKNHKLRLLRNALLIRLGHYILDLL